MSKPKAHWSKVLKQHVIQVETEKENLKLELVQRNEKINFMTDQLDKLEKGKIN
jgi:hypothetical protein